MAHPNRHAVLAALLTTFAPALIGAQGVAVDFDRPARSPLTLETIAAEPGMVPLPPGRPTPPAPGGASKPAFASGHEDDLWGTPAPWSASQARRFAHELEETAERLYNTYRANSDTGNFFKKISRNAALYALDNFRSACRHFHAQIESRWQDPSHTREDFRRVLQTLDGVDQVRYNYRFDRVAGEHREATRLAAGLAAYFRVPRDAGGWAEWERVRGLAHEVETQARHIHREAESRAHHGDYRERQALADLHALEEKAAHFHRQVESNRQDPRHTYEDFHELRRGFDAADRSLRGAHFDVHVRGDFEEVRRRLDELDWAYRRGGHGDPHDDPHHGDPHRGDHGHDRDRPW